jgi:hypothetical protein
MLLRLAILLTALMATAAAYAMRLPDTVPLSENVIVAPAALSHPDWERIGAHWRNTLPANAGPAVPWEPLICDKPWCGKNGSGFGWWSRDVAVSYNKSWPEAKRRIAEARR